ncbi:MAG TPA: pyrroline-5-carboxylate reductase [bacterium]|jgi:pyrroline-5-carboxylate reductase|nr:pyrroline-5-carboxylate reductase [bacterium]
MTQQTTLGVIGAGNMADALIKGIGVRGLLPPSSIWVTNRSNRARLQALGARYGVQTTAAKTLLLARSSVLVIAVKPADTPTVLDELRGRVGRNQLVISVVAGFPLSRLEGALPGVAVIRAMPNTSAAVQASATALATGTHVTADQLTMAADLFRAVGDVVVTAEGVLDVVTGLSGSGPAYVYYLIEAMIHAGVELGLSDELARRLAVQTLHGAAQMLVTTAEDPAELRRRVTSPGGTTMAALGVLADRGFSTAVRDAIERAAARAREMSGEPGQDTGLSARIVTE